VSVAKVAHDATWQAPAQNSRRDMSGLDSDTCDPREVGERPRDQPGKIEATSRSGILVDQPLLPGSRRLPKTRSADDFVSATRKRVFTVERRDRYPGSKVVRGRCRRRT
jgi:hypothetical protein